ncbi:MAG: SHOCT domain-containing protein [Candidatus Methylomirabilales bacterium]
MMQGRHTVRVAPSKAAAAALVVIGLLFLGLGVVLVSLGDTDDREVLLVRWLFALIWTAACLGMVAYGLSVLLRRTPPVGVTVSIEGSAGGEPPSDFEGRLRRLAALRKDGLISREEYDAKRAEILGERW